MMNELFNKYDVVKGYYLDEMELDYNDAPTKLVYVSKYDESISVNIIEDIYDNLLLDVIEMNYADDVYDSYEYAEKLKEMVEEKIEQAKRKARLEAEKTRIKAEFEARKAKREARLEEATQRFLAGNKTEQVAKETKKKPFWKKR